MPQDDYDKTSNGSGKDDASINIDEMAQNNDATATDDADREMIEKSNNELLQNMDSGNGVDKIQKPETADNSDNDIENGVEKKETEKEVPSGDDISNHSAWSYEIDKASGKRISKKMSRSIRATLTRCHLDVEVVPGIITKAIAQGNWDNFDDPKYEAPSSVDLFKLTMVGAAGFALVFIVTSLSFTDYPLYTSANVDQGHGDRLFCCLIFSITLLPLFAFFMFYDPNTYNWPTYRWWLIRFNTLYIFAQFALWEVLRDVKWGLDDPDMISMRETIMVSLCVVWPVFLVPAGESIGKGIGLADWKNPMSFIRGLDKDGNKIPHIIKAVLRPLCVLMYLTISFCTGCAWVVVDVSTIKNFTAAHWIVLRPLIFFLIKRNVWMAGNMVFQVSGMIYPQTRHYSPCGTHAVCALFTVIYLGSTPDYFSLCLYLFVDWLAWFVRGWAFSGKGAGRTCADRTRAVLKWQRMVNVGKQDAKILLGWFVLCEGIWQTIAYTMVFYLFPVCWFMDSITNTKISIVCNRENPAIAEAHTVNAPNILTYAFFSSQQSTIFCMIGFLNDYVQDVAMHRFVTQSTNCYYRRHFGRGNYRGMFHFLVAGWNDTWCIFSLMAGVKIARHGESIAWLMDQIAEKRALCPGSAPNCLGLTAAQQAAIPTEDYLTMVKERCENSIQDTFVFKTEGYPLMKGHNFYFEGQSTPIPNKVWVDNKLLWSVNTGN